MPGEVVAPETAAALAKLARDLKSADRLLRRGMAKRVRRAAGPVADLARAKAAEVSPKVARTIKVRSRLSGPTARVEIISDASRMPAGHEALPGLLENGNAGRAGAVFRHPVFGDKERWVSQPTHPFLRPALEEGGPAALTEIEGVIEDLAHDAGFH